MSETVWPAARRFYRSTSLCLTVQVPIFGQQTESDGGRAGLGARAGAELVQHRRDMVVDGLACDDELVRDLAVRQATGDEGEDLDLPARQTRPVGAGRGPRSAWDAG